MDLHLAALGRLRDTSVFTAREAIEHGLSADDINAYCRQRSVIRLGRGTYLEADVWQQADEPRRHVLMTSAHVLRVGSELRGGLALSHTSAAAWWKLPLLSVPTRGHMTRTHDGPGHARTRFTVHQRYGPEQCSSATDRRGAASQGVIDMKREGPPGPQRPLAAMAPATSTPQRALAAMAPAVHSAVVPSVTPVVSPALAALGVAHLEGFVPGVVALDAALRRELATRAEIDEWLGSLGHWPGLRLMRRAAAAADARSESPLETRARLVLSSLGFCPRLQVTLRTADGSFVARVDMLLEELGVVVEVDGRVKYADRSSTEVVLSEKRRESAIVDLGYAVLRVEHHHLDDLPGLDERIQAAARRSQPWRARFR
ncbi:MAG: hypothetical protein ACR2H3_05210 [Acidimicrobiales bacterium]